MTNCSAKVGAMRPCSSCRLRASPTTRQPMASRLAVWWARQRRLWAFLVRLPFRAAGWRPVGGIGLNVVSLLGPLVSAVAIKTMVDGVVQHDHGELRRGLSLFVVGIVLFHACGWASFILRQGMTER